jgi:hypothetical protein
VMCVCCAVLYVLVCCAWVCMACVRAVHGCVQCVACVLGCRTPSPTSRHRGCTLALTVVTHSGAR